MNYLDKLKHLNQRPNTVPTIQPGSHITWTRGDGTAQTGLIDVVHEDADGQPWAFVTLGESWAVVNMKFVTGLGDE